MAHAVARPEDILVAYDPDTVSVGNQADPLEVHGGRRAFREMTGGADTYHEDFTSGLRDFVTARAAAGGDAATGGSTLVGGWFGGAGADPSALVMGLDWLADGDDSTGMGILPDEEDSASTPDSEDDDSASEAPAGGLMSHVVSTDSPPAPAVRRSPEMNDLSSFIVGNDAPDGLEAELLAADSLEEAMAAPLAKQNTPAPRTAARANNLAGDFASSSGTDVPGEDAGPPATFHVAAEPSVQYETLPAQGDAPAPAGRSVLDLGTMMTDSTPRTLSADPVEDGFVAVGESSGGGPAWDLGFASSSGTDVGLTTLGAAAPEAPEEE